MPAIDIHHVNVKTLNLEATVAFYTEVLGMTLAPRPDLGPGEWLDFGGTQMHLIAGDMALNPDGGFVPGGACIDHIGIAARDFDAMKKIVIEHDLEWRQQDIKDAGMWQLFFHDPNDVLIELNFLTGNEPDGAVGPDDTNTYVPGTF